MNSNTSPTDVQPRAPTSSVETQDSLSSTKDKSSKFDPADLEKLAESSDSKTSLNEVSWDGHDDTENVRNMSKARKWLISIILTSGALCLTALSSAWGVANHDIVEHFHSVDEVGELGLSLYLLGLGAGPLISAPLSEFYGRRPVYMSGLLVFFSFQFLSAFPPNLASMIVGRVLSSMGGSVFMSNVPGSFADVFDKSELGLPMAVFTLGPFLGPGLGPIISGFIVQHVGYQWVFYVFLIWSFVLVVVVVAFVPETYGPVLLKAKAQRLRQQTGNSNLYAPLDHNSRSLLQSLHENCKRPVVLLATEPVLIFLCIYTGFLLAVIYMFFVAFPLVFQNVYGFDLQFIGLSFVGFSIGITISCMTYPIWNNLYHKETAKNNGVAEPEFRLPQMCVGAVISPIGLFMFAWTIYPSVHWIAPIIASGIFGFGSYLTVNAILTYTVESYRLYAASAIAANVFVRSVIGCSSPLFGVQLLNGLDYHWALSLMAFVAALLCPSAFIFRRYGRTLRLKSAHAYS